MVAAREEGGECGGSAGFGDYAKHAPKSLLRLRDFIVFHEDHFLDVLLSYREHEFADAFGCERVGRDAAGRAVDRASGAKSVC